MTLSPATSWSVAFLRELIAGGLEHVVVSPGSRSQALALAAVAWEAVPESPLQVSVAIDERSAGFLALGLALASGKPVACVSTSGSAPAHYHPAVLEALHEGVPLIILSADRPAELQGVGANQTTDQRGLFGPRVPCLSVDAPGPGDEAFAPEVAQAALKAALRPGPVQVNVSFREPLSHAVSLGASDLPEVSAVERKDGTSEVLELEPAEGTLVIAGLGAGARAEALAVLLGAPLIAEVHSGSRFGPHLVARYRQILADPEMQGLIRRVVCVGRPTLSREAWALLSRSDIEQIVVRSGEVEPATPSGVARVVDQVMVEKPATKEQASAWARPWVQRGRALQDEALAAVNPEAADLDALTSNDPATRSRFAKAEMEILRQPVDRASLALAVWEATWPHDRLVLGASRMVRELDQIAPGKNIPVFANRGLSGIDGTVATARGIAHAAARSGAQGITRVLLGDLAFLHDVGSLLVEPGEADVGRVHLVVANDGGGTIFDLLEKPEGISAEDIDRVLYTPHKVGIEHLAAAYGWDYLRVENRGDLAEAMSRSEARLIIEVALAR